MHRGVLITVRPLQGTFKIPRRKRPSGGERVRREVQGEGRNRNEEWAWRVMPCSQRREHEHRYGDRRGAWRSWEMIVLLAGGKWT